MKKGDRVKYSKEWFKQMDYSSTNKHGIKARAAIGTIQRILSGSGVSVLWDHAKLKQYFHMKYLEVVPE